MNTTVASGRRPSWLRTAALAAFSILAAVCLPFRALAATSGTCASGLAPVETQSGPVCGTVITVPEGNVQAYRGMPYATAGRWENPTPFGKWSGTFAATDFGPICPQQTTAAVPQSENCLSINVWRPEGGDDLPVMLFIYGGAFIEGFSASPLLDGTRLAAGQQAVVVSFNYRLGALGFLAGSFADGGALAGNFGFIDQQTALQWVHDNIGGFGGNSGNVTLFGESAGAMSVGLHLLSAPASKSLFQQAILESNPLSLPYKTPEEAAPFGTSLAKALGCETGGLACMKQSSVTAAEIVAAQLSKDVVKPAKNQGFVDFLVWAPILDGTIISGDPINGKIDKPTLLGTNLNEGNLFVDLIKSKLGILPLSWAYKSILKSFFGPSITDQVVKRYPINGDATAALSNVLNDYIFTCSHRHLAGQAKDPSQLWAYQFRPLTTYDIYKGSVPDCVQNASPTVQSPICHGDELPYVFNSWSGVGVTPSADETALTAAITGYWGSFAASGAPKGTVSWSAFGSTKKYLLLGQPTSAQADPFQAICSFWDPYGYDMRKVPSTLFKALTLK